MKAVILSLLFSIIYFFDCYSQNLIYESNSYTVKNPDKIFIGAILKSSSINTNALDFLNVPLNPVTVSFSLPIKSKEIIPTHDNMLATIREGLQNNKVLNPNYSFSFNTQEIESYNNLALHFGQNIDPHIFFGVPTKKARKTLVLISISQIFLQLYMDLPSNLCADPKTLEQFNKEELIYVSSISFGRKAMILIESNLDYGYIKEAVNNMLNGSLMSEKSRSTIANSTFRIMTIGNSDMETINTDNPLANIVNYMNKPVTPDDFGLPIEFSASKLDNNEMYINKFYAN